MCPGGICGSYGRDARRNFREGSFDLKLKILVQFLRVSRDWMVTRHLHAPFSPKASDKNFQIAVLLKIVQRSDNKISGVDTTPQGPGAGVVRCALDAYTVLMKGILV